MRAGSTEGPSTRRTAYVAGQHPRVSLPECMPCKAQDGGSRRFDDHRAQNDRTREGYAPATHQRQSACCGRSYTASNLGPAVERARHACGALHPTILRVSACTSHLTGRRDPLVRKRSSRTTAPGAYTVDAGLDDAPVLKLTPKAIAMSRKRRARSLIACAPPRSMTIAATSSAFTVEAQSCGFHSACRQLQATGPLGSPTHVGEVARRAATSRRGQALRPLQASRRFRSTLSRWF